MKPRSKTGRKFIPIAQPQSLTPMAARISRRGSLRVLVHAQAALVFAALFPVAAAGETYSFDSSGSTIGFSVHQLLGTTRGKFTKFNGRIDLDRQQPEHSSVIAQIDVRSIDTRIKKRDDHLRSAEFLNAEKFPYITFKSRSVRRTGPQSGDILGDLTVHGVTKPVTLHVKLLSPLSETGRTRWAVATEPIMRRDFNLSFAPWSESLFGVSQSVAINIEIEAKRAEERSLSLRSSRIKFRGFPMRLEMTHAKIDRPVLRK